MYRILAALALLALTSAAPAHSAVVGTFNAVGDQITTPLAFNANVFNSFSDVPGGLNFVIAPGLSGPVKLELLQSTANVKVAAAAIGTAFGITQSLPLSIVSPEAFAAGIHSFAVGAVTAGSKEGAVIARLTLTPLPGSLLLLAPAVTAIGVWNFARRRPEASQAA